MRKIIDLYKEDLELQASRIDLEKIKDKSFLVTGANGLICSYFVDLLVYLNENKNANITIHALARNIEKTQKRYEYCKDKEYLKFVIQDVCEPIEIDGVDYILHGASNATPNLYVEDPVGTMNSNYIGMLNALNCAVKNNSKVVYISSSEVYGEPYGDKDMFTEDMSGYFDILSVRSSYPSSKRAAETLCVAFKEQYGIDVCMVRPAHIYGPTITPSDKRAVADFIHNVLDDKDICMNSDGSAVRSYCYVGDAVAGIFKVFTNGESGSAYNISNNEDIISIKELATLIAELNDRKVIINVSNQNQKQVSKVKHIMIDNKKLSDLGWENKVDIKEGITKTVNILKEMK